MALILAFRNTTALAPISDYEAGVYINDHLIAGPFTVTGHPRSDGWAALVQRLLDQLPKETH